MASADKQVRSKQNSHFLYIFLLTFKGKSPSKEQKTLKEIEDQKAAIKKAHERKVYKRIILLDFLQKCQLSTFQDDIAMVFGLLVIMLITVAVVVVKITVIDPKPNLNVSTFKPLPQQKHSNEKYTFVGYIPCNGYVPCQVG